MPDMTMPQLGPTPPSWGRPEPGRGRIAHAARPSRYQATTVQGCGLYPYTSGSGAPAVGVPMGRHMLWGEVVALDPIDWVRAGLCTNPGLYILGEPGVGKSAFTKRLATGLVAYGTGVVVLGDLKGEYSGLVRQLGGQVVRIGWGLDRINPLDAGALSLAAATLDRTDPEKAAALRAEVRSRRLDLLLALCLIARGSRGAPVTDAEELALGGALDLLARRTDREPLIPEVMHTIEAAGPDMEQAVLARSSAEYRQLTDSVLRTLARICRGILKGLFDAPTTAPADLRSPAVSIDLFALDQAADDIVAASMLCTWAYGFGSIDAARAAGDRRPYLTVQDELWRSLRVAPGLVERTDRVSRLNRGKGIGSVITTHSLADSDALPTPEDRIKARGLIERAAITVMGALPDNELARVHQVRALTSRERQLVASWSAPESWEPGRPHPGRGKYLIKNAGRLGIPVEMTLTTRERELYNTDQAIRASRR